MHPRAASMQRRRGIGCRAKTSRCLVVAPFAGRLGESSAARRGAGRCCELAVANGGRFTACCAPAFMKKLLPLAASIALVLASPVLRAETEYQLTEDSKPHDGVPKGELIKFQFDDSKIFPGTDARCDGVCAKAV